MSFTTELASLFTDHLVLCRDRENPIWGRDRAQQTVRLRVSGPFETEASTRADDSGRFVLSCPPLPAGGPYRMTLEGSSRVVLEDVWVGEVWLASGQSNMEWPLRAAKDAEREIGAANFPALRVFKVARATAREPLDRVEGEWTVCSPDTAGGFTAVGYAFARELHRVLGVAVGVIDATWGGTSIDSWLSVPALCEAEPSVRTRLAELAAQERDLPRLRAEQAAAVRAWELRELPRDPPNTGESSGWARPEFDDGAWPSLILPSFWQHHGLKFNGVVWFRRELVLSGEAAERELELELGAIDDFDHTYFNGVLVGSHPDGTPDAYQIPRRYRVPAHLVRAGKNTIAVRVFDHFGEGGFAGPAAAMFARTEAGERVRLDGAWRYAVEHEVPLVQNTVWASYPPPPLALMAQGIPGVLHNAMLAPLFPYGIRGVIWYQGENDVETHANYATRQRALMHELRRRFAQRNLSFYSVQLAGFRANACWPYLREAQFEAAREPDAGMVTAVDVGEADSIHPLDKQTVGARLALLARHKAYGEAELEASGPIFERAQIEAETVRVFFSHAEGLRAGEGKVRGFILAGDDGIFHNAEAELTGTSVLVRSAYVPRPRFVRYAWADISDANLQNAASLPAFPFRTDSFVCPNH